MQVTVFPSKAKGVVFIPPSKSFAHRALICAALAKGRSEICNFAMSKDMQATINAMRSFGAIIEQKHECIVVDGGALTLQKPVIDCLESGSTLRFLLPLASLFPDEVVTFVGQGKLLKRPMGIYEDIWKKQGLYYQADHQAIRVKGKLSPGDYHLDGNVSSQFITGLLFLLCMLKGDSTIDIRGPVTSRSYIDISLDVMRSFGVKVQWTTDNVLLVPGRQAYQPQNYVIEGDWSQAAFFTVMNAFGHDVAISGLSQNSIQGDRVIADMLTSNADTFSIEDCPDLGPILMVYAALREGKTTHIVNAGRLRMKESDRIASMERELAKLGVRVKSEDDSITITGGKLQYNGIPLYGHNDHRVVMSLAVAAILADQPVVITGAEAVQKSYPAFFEDLQSLQIKMDIIK